MTEFENTKVFKIIKERWAGKDMEVYFIEKNKKFIEKLKKDLGKQLPNKEKVRIFRYINN